MPGSSEEKAGRAPKKTWLVDVVDVLLLGLGCPKKRSPNSDVDVSFNGYRLKQIREYVMLLSGLPHRRDPWKINEKKWKSPSQSY